MRWLATILVSLAATVSCSRGERLTVSPPARDAATGSAAALVSPTADAAAAPAPAPVNDGDVRGFGKLVVRPTKRVAPKEPAELVLEIVDDGGKRVTDLEVVHEKVVHLLVVSSDLSFFLHEHPAQEADGRLRLAGFVVPHAGRYILFADHRPKGGAPRVARAVLEVDGLVDPPRQLGPEALPTRRAQGDFAVTLTADVAPMAGRDARLRFAITERGNPVTDLRNYLGARGHCVGIRERADRYLHSHPLGKGGGNEVEFHTVFPEPGIYKIWAEFRPRGEVLRVEFTIDVPAAPAEHDAPAAATGTHSH